MKKIKLKNGREVFIDDEDFVELSTMQWHQVRDGGVFTAFKENDGLRHVYMHRYLLNLIHSSPSKIVDHINGNPLDNRKSNLRISSFQQNSRNRKGPNSNNKSGHIGVYKSGSKWRANICVDGKTISLGRFINLADAIAARKEAEKVYF